MSNLNQNKKAFLDYKEKLLSDIKYYEKSIEDFRANDKNNNFYDDTSSDSEEEWLSTINMGPNAVELKREQSKLRTYLQATQELTGLTVLQFEINVLVDEPKIDGERPVLEVGTWREVTAECRVDLVPFSITFFVHTPDRKFGQPSYRGARVQLVKAPHEAELAGSVLRELATPSAAVEVLRSYAAAYRSRRTTLARLANKYTNTLLMEPHDEGGFVLKCANLLEIIWKLENKRSQVASFHHKMKFDLEYMDESYIRIISQCHKQLSDPTLQTDERTLILAKIITTCLEARGQTDHHDAVESDLESKTTDCDLKKDSEVMAPPKSLPKKAKSKIATNVAQERSNDEGSKRMKANDNNDNARNDENSQNAPNTAPSSISEGSKRIKTNDAAKNKENTKKISNIAQKTSIYSNENEVSKRIKSNDNTKNNDNAKTVPNTAQKRSNNDNNNERTKRMKSTDNIKATSNTAVAKVNEDKDSITQNNNKDVNGIKKTDKAKRNIATAKNSTNTVPETTEVNENTVGNTKNVKSHNKNKAIGITSKEAKNVPDNIKANTKNKSEIGKNDPPTKNSIDSAEAKTAGGLDTIEGANTKIKVTKDKNKAKNAANTNKVANTTDTNKVINKNDDQIDTNIKNKVIKDKNKVKNADNANTVTNSINNNNDDNIDVNIINEGNNNIKSAGNTKNSIDTANAKNSRINQVTKIKKSVVNKKISTDTTNAKRAQDRNDNQNADAKSGIEKQSVAKTKSDAKNGHITAANSNNDVNDDPKSAEGLKCKTNKEIQDANIPKSNTMKKVTDKNMANTKLKDKIADRDTNGIPEKSIKDIHTSNTRAEKMISGNLKKKFSNNMLLRAGNIKTSKIFKSNNIEKENGRVVSKIPQKKLTPTSAKLLNSNPLRISPRTFQSKFKTQLPNKNIMKTTSIPRLLKKSVTKT